MTRPRSPTSTALYLSAGHPVQAIACDCAWHVVPSHLDIFGRRQEQLRNQYDAEILILQIYIYDGIATAKTSDKCFYSTILKAA